MTKELLAAKVLTATICVLNIYCLSDISAYYFLDQPISVYGVCWVVCLAVSGLLREIQRWDKLRELKEEEK